MTKVRTTNTKEHEKFCLKDGWEYKRGGNHKKYVKLDSEGKPLSTPISHGYKEYSKKQFKYILKTQLKVSEEYYFSVIG